MENHKKALKKRFFLFLTEWKRKKKIIHIPDTKVHAIFLERERESYLVAFCHNAFHFKLKANGI